MNKVTLEYESGGFFHNGLLEILSISDRSIEYSIRHYGLELKDLRQKDANYFDQTYRVIRPTSEDTIIELYNELYALYKKTELIGIHNSDALIFKVTLKNRIVMDNAFALNACDNWREKLYLLLSPIIPSRLPLPLFLQEENEEDEEEEIVDEEVI